MTTVTLGALLDARDESLALKRSRPTWLSHAWTRLRQAQYAAVTARMVAQVVALALTLAGLAHRHALVLGGLAAFVVAAASLSSVAGWVMAGVSLLFLEVRRR
jgi:uncharacterized membrane protein YkgB